MLQVQQNAYLQNHRVLLVEDDSAYRSILTTILDSLGYESLIADNGEQAVLLAKSEKVNVILMDVRMLGMNGFKACLLIRRWESQYRLPRIPIIGLTSLNQLGDRDLCLRAGMDDHIAKPACIDELSAKLKRYCQLPDDSSADFRKAV